MGNEMTEKQVLIVDDQENWRIALKTLIEEIGARVTAAPDFAEAQRMLAAVRFDLVVLDVRLVDQDEFNVEGLDLLNLIHAASPETKTVILTGYPESIRLTPPEADAFIFKVPQGAHFDSRAFKKRIKELLMATSENTDRRAHDHKDFSG